LAFLFGFVGLGLLGVFGKVLPWADSIVTTVLGDPGRLAYGWLLANPAFSVWGLLPG
jgi:hypothetical protein